MNVIDKLLNDYRLARLFTDNANHCALQLWILQIKAGNSLENRLIYGRLLPYNYSSSSWLSSDDENFCSFGEIQTQLIRTNLYITSALCEPLLRHLSSGRSIAAISKEMQLELSDRQNARFGMTALISDKLAYRPVAYLLNRDGHDLHSLSSPHGQAGAFSASITQTDKEALLCVGDRYDVALTEALVDQLNAETGLDFGGVDLSRFGDLELLVFPTLDDMERSLLSITWAHSSPSLLVQFDSRQVAYFSGFQFRLNVMNNGQIMYSAIRTAESDANGMFVCEFELGHQLRAIADGTELEIFGFTEDHFHDGTLCCRWRGAYFREISFQTHIVGQQNGPIKFDWLEKTTRPSALARTQAALTVNRGEFGFTNRVGGREADPWVTANRDLVSLFTRLCPPKSEGRFFKQWGQGDREGRLQFVEWLRALFTKHQRHQIIIFDPWFESAGVNLLLLLGAPNADFIIFTSLPKQNARSNATTGTFGKPTTDRIDSLVASCEQNRSLLQRFKLRIYGLKDGRLVSIR